jgi:hypothetical protein
VAGDAAALLTVAAAWFWGGGVLTPFLDGVLDSAGPDWLAREMVAEDPLGEPGTDGATEELDTLGFCAEGRFFGWRCEIGNKGSGCLCFLRPSLKKAVVACAVWLFAALPPWDLSPELASDLEDSESLWGGSASVEGWLSE